MSQWTKAGLLVGVGVTVLPAAGRSQVMDLAARAPEEWAVRTDRVGAGDPPRVERRNGRLHIRTGAAGIFHLPVRAPTGVYTVTADFHQFDPAQRNEAYGVFVGGKDLSGDNIAYTYFLIRRDGSALVKRREGSRTRVLRDWSVHDVINAWDDRPAGVTSVRNVLKISVDVDSVRFMVNDRLLHSLPRDVVESDGTPGLRINHGIDVEIQRLLVTEERAGGS